MANRHPGRRHQHRRVKYDGGRHHGFDRYRFGRVGFDGYRFGRVGFDGYRFVRVGFVGVGVVGFLKRFRLDRNLRLRHV
jgi:hypothetical protein